VLTNALTLSSAGFATLNHTARGGNGGNTDTGVGGRGGNAQSTLNYLDTTSGSITATVSAFGGNGGQPQSQGVAGNGGSATSTLVLSSQAPASIYNGGIFLDGSSHATGGTTGGTGLVGSDAYATSSVTYTGDGIATIPHAPPQQIFGSVSSYATAASNSRASANALASATQANVVGAVVASNAVAIGTMAFANATSHSVGATVAMADAQALGGSGGATAQSVAVNDQGHQVIMTASTGANNGVASSSANFSDNTFGGVAQLNDPGYGAPGAIARGMGGPDATTMASFVTTGGTPNSAAALANQSLIGLGVLGANYAGGTGSQSFTSSAEYIVNTTGTFNLTLALLGITSNAGGFDFLSFSLTDNGTNLLSQSFTDLGSAQAYFSDDAITLYNLASNADIVLTFTLTAASIEGSSVMYALSSTAALAPVPLPPSFPLMLGALGGLAWLGRRDALRLRSRAV
jgi:hypothetical protein